MNKITHPELYEDLSNMEDALVRLEPSADIWQNKIITALCKAVYHILVWIIKKDSRNATYVIPMWACDKCGTEFPFGEIKCPKCGADKLERR